MDSKKLKFMKDILEAAIPLVDSVPLGEFIPSTWEPPKGYENKKLLVDNVPVEHLIPENKGTSNVILQFHGGGYVLANIDPCREATVKYSKAAGDAEVFSVDYRVAPTNNYPAALEDAIKVYKWLLEKGYDNKNIIFAGDSAGGNLALVLTLYLKDKKMPLPKAIIAISPWGNVSNESPSIKYNYEKDLILGKYGLSIGKEVIEPIYFKEADVKNDPYASPILGDYNGFPSLLLIAGAYELLLEDSKVINEKAEKAGVNVKLKIYEEMPHDFLMLINGIEETEDAWNTISQFIKENM